MYDKLFRVKEEKWYDGATLVNTIDYAYDAVGNLLEVSDDFSHYFYEYDDLDRVTSIDNAGTPNVPHVVLTYAYDAVGNVLSASDDAGVTVTSTYDPRNMLATQTWQGGGIDAVRVEYGYNDRAQRTSINRFADLTAEQPSVKTTFVYDDDGRFQSIRHRDSLDDVMSSYDYTYDFADQLIQQSHNGDTISYSYDAAGQLTAADSSAASDQSYQYDENGNRIMTGYIVGSNNEILSDGVFNYSYDAEGNLIRKDDLATEAYSTLAYDHRNRLTQVNEYSADGSLVSAIAFVYDAMDHRIAEEVDGVRTSFVYDKDGMIWADFNADGSVAARYLVGANVDEMIARWRPADGTAWYLNDMEGSIGDVVDSAFSQSDAIAYDSFGNILSETDASFGDRFKFTGREYDASTGLYYYRARYYDPALGRFISQDPIGFEAGDSNLYRYVFNSPLTQTDPTGNQPAAENATLKAKGVLVVLLSSKYSCIVESSIDLAITAGTGGLTAPAAVWAVTSCAVLPITSRINGKFLLVATILKKINESKIAKMVNKVIERIQGGAKSLSKFYAVASAVSCKCNDNIQDSKKPEMHHPIAKFLLGNKTQPNMTELERTAHKELHCLLRQALKQAGFPNVGGPGGGKKEYQKFFKKNGGSQAQAFALAISAAVCIDAKYGKDGVSATSDILKNIQNHAFEAIGWK